MMSILRKGQWVRSSFFTNRARINGALGVSPQNGRLVYPLWMEFERYDGTIEWRDSWWYADELEACDAPGEPQPAKQVEQLRLF